MFVEHFCLLIKKIFPDSIFGIKKSEESDFSGLNEISTKYYEDYFLERQEKLGKLNPLHIEGTQAPQKNNKDPFLLEKQKQIDELDEDPFGP